MRGINSKMNRARFSESSHLHQLKDGVAKIIFSAIFNLPPYTRGVIKERERHDMSLSWFEPTSEELHQTFKVISTDWATAHESSKLGSFVGMLSGLFHLEHLLTVP